MENKLHVSFVCTEEGKERLDRLCKRRRFARGVAIEALLDFYERITEVRDDITALQREGYQPDLLEALGQYHDAAHLDLDVEEVDE